MGVGSSKKIYIFEINENHSEAKQKKYARELESLENFVSDKLNEELFGYLFFTTGYDDILEYIKDKDMTVMECQDNDKKIIAAAYITQKKGLYSYDDLSKYFKFNKEYIEYAKSKYDPKELCSIQYETFMKKIEGYEYAKRHIDNELDITDLVGHCISEKVKGTFDEKNKVREKVNRYIYDYFEDDTDAQDRIGLTELDRFYLLKFSDLQNCEDKEIKAKCEKETEENKKLYEEYGELIDLFDLNDSILPDENGFEYMKSENYKKYFDANPFNTIEIDTCIVHPDNRTKGLARIVTFEGLKIQIRKLLKKRPKLEKIFISATVHQENVPLKRIISSFGNFDTLYVKRRTGINREVYFCEIDRNNIEDFIKENERKIQTLKDKIKKESSITFKKIEL